MHMTGYLQFYCTSITLIDDLKIYAATWVVSIKIVLVFTDEG